MGFNTNTGVNSNSTTSSDWGDPYAKPTYKLPTSFTNEQLAIIESDDRLILGQALAGTGKSTTGLGYAATRPHEKILVLCFNTANANEAKEKYPHVSRNAHAKTVHAVAYSELDEALRHRVPGARASSNTWNTYAVRNDLSLLGVRPDLRTAAITRLLLTDFFNSVDEAIETDRHSNSAMTHSPTSRELERCAIYANRLWQAMKSVAPISGMRSEENLVLIPHDAYLKLFSMKSQRLNYDTIIFDEAQDANPIMLRILHEQYRAGVKLIMLGDAHQSIYDFRGAVNGMLPENMPDVPAVYPLTQSWRMGPRTASIANLLLKDLKGDSLRIKAMGQDTLFDEAAPKTLLARRNITLVEAAIAVRGKGAHWVGGIEGYRVSLLLDGWNLYVGNRADISDYNVKKMHDYAELEEAARYEPEMNLIKDLIEEYQSEIPKIVADLRKNEVLDAEKATLTLCTAHKAKGLEWDYVEIANDFQGSLKGAELWLQGDDEADFPEQEINLLYVASTRAKKSLKISAEMYDWLVSLDSYRPLRTRSWAEMQMGPTSPLVHRYRLGSSDQEGAASQPITPSTLNTVLSNLSTP